MSTDLEQASTGRTRKTRADKGVKRPQPTGATKTIETIDARLSQLIEERAHAARQVANIEGWQRKLKALESEINTLVIYLQRLTGSNAAVIGTANLVDPMEILAKTMVSRTADPPGYSFAADISPTVGSISANERAKGPRPTTPNAVDIAGEGGFS